MAKKYDIEYLKDVLENAGLKAIGEVLTASGKVLCKTQEGYLVLAIPLGIFQRGDKPSVFSKYNPYTIYNINLWLKNNNIDTIELLSDTYENSKVKLKWLCKNCGKEFYMSWNDAISGKRYCNYCAKSLRYDNFRDYYAEIKKECDKRQYTLLTHKINRSNDEFKYICNKHKDKGVQSSYYDRFINHHQGCKYCGIESRGVLHRMSEDKIKTLVENKGLIYCGINYDNSNTKYKKVNIQVICPKHKDKGVQIMKYDNLLHSSGKCIYCIGQGRTQEDLQLELDNMQLEVTVVQYTKYAEPIIAKCNICGHEWKTSGVNLTQGHRCPNCSKSKFEIEVQNILKKHNINYKSEYWFADCRDKNPLPFDFYLVDKNILIEADGEGHYRPIKWSLSMTDDDALNQLETVRHHDNIKNNYCKDNNIPLIRIPYWERSNLENYILESINKIN